MKTLAQILAELKGYLNTYSSLVQSHAPSLKYLTREDLIEVYGKVLNQIKDWFAVEKESREDNLSYEERLTIRKDSLVESFEEFKKWMIQQIGEETPQSPIRKACNYGLGQWDGFKPFLTDGRVELSNNLVENIIRPVTLGRKNYLFKGSENGAKRGAIIYSIIATAKLHDLDPLQYIKMLLKELPNTQSNDIDKFMPDTLK